MVWKQVLHAVSIITQIPIKAVLSWKNQVKNTNKYKVVC